MVKKFKSIGKSYYVVLLCFGISALHAEWQELQPPSFITVLIHNKTAYFFDLSIDNEAHYHIAPHSENTLFIEENKIAVFTAFAPSDTYKQNPLNFKKQRITKFSKKIILYSDLNGWHIKTSLWPFKINRHIQSNEASILLQVP